MRDHDLMEAERMKEAAMRERARYETVSQVGLPKDASCEANSPSNYSKGMLIVERLSIRNVEEAFRYQPWGPAQTDAGEQVRDALVAAAKAILRNVPETPTRTRALNALIDARMLANAAISFNGRF